MQIQTLNSMLTLCAKFLLWRHQDEIYVKQHQVLKEEVRKTILSKVENDVDKLDLIDVMQRLGVAYHFKSEIRNILDTIHNMNYSKNNKTLHATALKFRILRHNGYHISAGFSSSILLMT
ncbi:hypothetical protein PIB30_011471 [Stylosanthes scabra]|uniref:Terpene synthase N-terminal domain-containing protein n=1 Tax=Stylosanthes scabra TaxID=79078 RepID=A0ABU6R6Q4_9FABA|nr:hypothetical protein [Stylosanthes scabra]